jgi:subtilase family serine protease
MRSLCSAIPQQVSALTLLAVIVFTLSLAQPTTAQQQAALVAPRPLITQPVDESQLTVLKGNTHPLARPEFNLGAAPATLPMQRMLLVLKRSPEQESALRQLLDNQQDKSSPSYHKWLTPAEYGKQFGPTDADIQTITAWLQSHGFQVGSTKGRTVLEFSGSASQLQEAFHTTIHKYIVNGEQHWANASDPSIPTALTPAVAGVKTLHNFLKKPMVHIAEKYIPAKFIPKSRPQFTSSTGSHALTPEDYATIYNGGQQALSGIDGTGITIAVVARSNLFNHGTGPGSDVAEFRNVFGLPPSTFALSIGLNVLLDGPDPGDLGGDDELEATLDASWSGALATGALIDFVVSATTNTTDGIDLSELFIIENNLGNVMTESFGVCELAANADALGNEQLAEQAAAQGITYMVSAGDTGAEGCDNLSETIAKGGIAVSALASTPFDVAVGGPCLTRTATTLPIGAPQMAQTGDPRFPTSRKTSGMKPALRNASRVNHHWLPAVGAPASFSFRNPRGSRGSLAYRMMVREISRMSLLRQRGTIPTWFALRAPAYPMQRTRYLSLESKAPQHRRPLSRESWRWLMRRWDKRQSGHGRDWQITCYIRWPWRKKRLAPSAMPPLLPCPIARVSLTMSPSETIRFPVSPDIPTASTPQG